MFEGTKPVDDGGEVERDRERAAIARYTAAAHAMQSGVAMEMERDPAPTQPKHLRVGVNSAMVEGSALAELLIQKGVITRIEYLEAIAAGMEREQRTYEARISALLGGEIKLA